MMRCLSLSILPCIVVLVILINREYILTTLSEYFINFQNKMIPINSMQTKHDRHCLTHWGRVTHIWVSKLTIIGSDNGLSPGGRQSIIWTNAGILLIVPLGTIFSDIWTGIQTFSFKKMHVKMSSANWRPFCLGLNMLMITSDFWYHKVPTYYPSTSLICMSIVSKFLDHAMYFSYLKLFIWASIH